MTEFFTQLIESLQKEAARRPGMNASQETLKDLFTEVAKAPEFSVSAAQTALPQEPVAVRKEEHILHIPKYLQPFQRFL